MPEKKYAKYIVTDLKKNITEAPWSPPLSVAGEGKGGRLLFLDDEVVPGAFYVETVWVTPRKPEESVGRMTKSHTHDYDEVLGFFGTNPDDIHDLQAEAEFWLDDEKHILTRSCMVFVPKGLQHGPLRFVRVDKPVFHFSSGMGKTYF
ncbi:MAG: hypothetical protein ABSD38_18020 [Syntrophorhabdales bacterium]|jgi:hypothetical protein